MSTASPKYVKFIVYCQRIASLKDNLGFANFGRWIWGMRRPRKSGLGYCTKFTGKRAFRTKKIKRCLYKLCVDYVYVRKFLIRRIL